ncbi:hypothetical protein BDZ91DRAFT_717202 [Kalaharituber pfeilii]|nr:hypothetical protein BDZ91DRAFT_717202 [Kalaharituber pfeilii]
MASALLSYFSQRSPSSSHTTPATILSLAQHAPSFLSSPAAARDTPETWLLYENLLLVCLRSQDDSSARLCLQRLSDRFGAANERVMALAGLFDEATAGSRADLEAILKRYEEILAEDPTNTPIHKRLISLLTHLNYPHRAISNLTTLVSNNPTDAESWAELSSLYFQQGLYPQSIFCLEEIILMYPNAYNIFARLGEVTYVHANNSKDNKDPTQTLTDSLKYYLRSIELCDDYLRGYYGTLVVTGKLLQVGKLAAVQDDDKSMTKGKVEKLQQLATRKLAEIVRRAKRKEKGWEGYAEAEVQAAAKLLEEIQGEQAPK